MEAESTSETSVNFSHKVKGGQKTYLLDFLDALVSNLAGDQI
jgi:hypothetical protein